MPKIVEVVDRITIEVSLELEEKLPTNEQEREKWLAELEQHIQTFPPILFATLMEGD